jgi:hypothetical protein
MKRVNLSQVPECVEKREEFVSTSETLRGIKSPDVLTACGTLDDKERPRFLISLNNVGIAYLVTSYGTPIAWVRNDGIVQHVEQRLGRYIENHKSLVTNLR